MPTQAIAFKRSGHREGEAACPCPLCLLLCLGLFCRSTRSRWERARVAGGVGVG
jgi:hypothetical protein